MQRPNRAPFAQLSGPLLRLGLDLAAHRIAHEDYLRQYDAVIEACGWTREEYYAEIDKHWSGEWALKENPTA